MARRIDLHAVDHACRTRVREVGEHAAVGDLAVGHDVVSPHFLRTGVVQVQPPLVG
jgi:hypothetical protein